MAATAMETTTAMAPERGKYVLIRLAGETYGLLLVELQEVIAQYEITVLPELPEHYVGVIGLRREVIPVLSLRRRFGLADRDRGGSTRVIVVDVRPHPIGVEVDSVARVVTIPGSDIEPPGDLRDQRPYLRGMSGAEDGKLVIHLDIRRLVEASDRVDIEEVRAAMEARDGSDASDGEAVPKGQTQVERGEQEITA